MAQQYFVLGIGGTGMRCIESLLHLCGMGMFDDTDIYLLALDTDKDNGNFNRLKEVKESYVKAKGTDSSQRTALSEAHKPQDLHSATYRAMMPIQTYLQCLCIYPY